MAIGKEKKIYATWGLQPESTWKKENTTFRKLAENVIINNEWSDV